MKKFMLVLMFLLAHMSARAEFKIIVPFSPGGAIDVVARNFAAHVERTTGESVTVENVLGAGSTVGTRRLVESSGNVAMVSSSSFYVNITYGTFDAGDFKLASTIAESPMLLAVPASKKLTCEILRTTSKPMFIGSAGKDSITSVPTKFVTDKFKNYTEVPYKGVSQALIDLIAGRLDVVFLASKLDRPELDILANTSMNKYDGLPSIKECMGINTPSNSQWVLVTNKNASPAFIKRLNELAQAYVKDPDTLSLFKERTIRATATGLEQTNKQYTDELKHWEKILK